MEELKNLERKKIVSIRMSEDEIRFLRNIGSGDMSRGLRAAIEKAGHKTARKKFLGYRVVKELLSQGGERCAQYNLYLNGELVGNPLTVSDSLFKALTERHGENFVMEDVIIRSFVNLPREVEIDKVYDRNGSVVWSKYN